MATGFSVMDALNKNSKAGIEETPKARFRTKDISIFKMYRNEMNFYSIAAVEELAGDILTFGLKQNLELVYEPCEKGEYRIVAGERRWLALKMLVSKGYKEFEMATSKLTTPQDADEEQVEIIIANAYRNKSVADMIEEEKRLKESLEKMKAAGKQIKGYDLTSGRLRDVIASMLHMSKTKVAQIESVNNNLIPEFKEELKSERLTFSAAYELSGMTTEEQQEALERFKESGELSHKDIKTMKGEKTGQQDTQKPTGEGAETATEGQNGSEPEKSTPEFKTLVIAASILEKRCSQSYLMHFLTALSGCRGNIVHPLLVCLFTEFLCGLFVDFVLLLGIPLFFGLICLCSVLVLVAFCTRSGLYIASLIFCAGIAQ